MLGAKLGIVDKQYNIVTDGLVAEVQPSFKSSYPGTGTAIDPNGTLSGDGITFYGASGNAGGYFDFDGTDDYISFSAFDGGNLIGNVSRTIECWVISDATADRQQLLGWGGGLQIIRHLH